MHTRSVRLRVDIAAFPDCTSVPSTIRFFLHILRGRSKACSVQTEYSSRTGSGSRLKSMPNKDRGGFPVALTIWGVAEVMLPNSKLPFHLLAVSSCSSNLFFLDPRRPYLMLSVIVD